MKAQIHVKCYSKIVPPSWMLSRTTIEKSFTNYLWALQMDQSTLLNPDDSNAILMLLSIFYSLTVVYNSYLLTFIPKTVVKAGLMSRSVDQIRSQKAPQNLRCMLPSVGIHIIIPRKCAIGRQSWWNSTSNRNTFVLWIEVKNQPFILTLDAVLLIQKHKVFRQWNLTIDGMPELTSSLPRWGEG